MRVTAVYLFSVLFLILSGACASAKKEQTIIKVEPSPKRAAVYRDQAVEDKLFGAAAKLFAIHKGQPYGCGAAVIMREKNDYYLFLTTAHCLIVDPKKEKKDWEYFTDLRLRLKNPVTKKFEYYPAKRVILDYDKDKAFDFGLVEARVPRELPVLAFSQAELKVNDCVVSVAYPQDGSGADIFYGFVVYTTPGVEAFAKFGQIKEPYGASGAAVASCHTGEIVGIIIGHDKKDKEKIYMLLEPHVMEFFRSELKKRGYWPKE